MAYDYNKAKKAYQSLSKEQQKQYVQQNQNDANFQRFYTDYMNEINGRTNTVSTPTQTVANPNIPTNTYGDTGGAANATKYTGQGVSSAGNYTYNQNLTTGQLNSKGMLFGSNAENYERQTPGYLEQRNNAIANALYNEGKTDRASVSNYLNTFQDYRDYDLVGQNNTVDAIMNRIGSMAIQYGNNNQNGGNDLNSRLMSEIWNNYNNGNKGYSDLMGGGSYPQDFDTAVKNKLKTAYGISNLDEFQQKYPEQYKSLVESLEAVRGVRDATDPTQRQMLDGALQGIIGSGVGAGSDWSKISVLEESVMNKFKNPDQIKSDAQNVIKLQTEGYNTGEIADRMGMSEDQVQQLILLANGLDSKAGEYYQLKSDVAKDITEPYDTKMQRLEEEKKIQVDRANRNLEWLKSDFDTNIERQKEQNDINLHNADFLAGQYGYGFSRRGIEGLNYVATQAQQIIDDLTKNYDRNSIEIADGISDIIRNWQWNNDDLMKASQDALTNAKNSFTSNMLAIQQQYGTVGIQAQQALSNNVQAFIEQAETIYDNALTRQQQNLSNLITNVSNLNALSAQNLTLRNAKIQQFQAESMNLNRNQLQSLAQQLGMDTNSYQDLVNYQVQAVQNELNGYVAGAGVQFQSQIQSLLDQGYTPTQAMQSIMNSADFKAMQQAANGTQNKRAMSNGIMYNQATGEYMNLNQDEYGTVGNNIYNKRTGEIITADGNTVSTTDANGNYQRVKLGEDVVDTGIANVYGSTVKLAPTVGNMLQNAIDTLSAKGIELQIGDSYRSYETQKKAYEEDQAKPANQRKGVAKPGTSYHEIGQAIDIAQSQMNDPEVIQALLDAGFTRPVASEKRHWSYGEGKDMFGGTPSQADNGPLTDYGVPISYDRSIKAMIPTQLMNSEVELNKLESNIENLYKAGYSAEDAVLQYMGFNVTDEDDKAMAMNLVNAVRSLSNEDNVQSAVSYISQRINAGDYNGAINKVENLVRQEAKKNEGDGYFDESTARGLITKANALIELANSLPEDIGVFQGTMQKYLKKLKSSDASKLQTAIAYLTDEQRLKQVGSNVSEHELEMVKNWIPQIDDRTDTFMNKINQLKQNALTSLNSWRQTYGLPALDESSLLDNKKRVNLYSGVTGGRGLQGTVDLTGYGRS